MCQFNNKTPNRIYDVRWYCGVFPLRTSHLFTRSISQPISWRIFNWLTNQFSLKGGESLMVIVYLASVCQYFYTILINCPISFERSRINGAIWFQCQFWKSPCCGKILSLTRKVLTHPPALTNKTLCFLSYVCIFTCSYTFTCMPLLLLAHLSTKCSWWAIVFSQCPS